MRIRQQARHGGRTTRLPPEADGSVKNIIGHTKAAAGVAGLIKATLALYRRILPPHVIVDQPNKVLQEIDSPLYLLDQPAPWLSAADKPRRAAVSAFGFGGTNFHVIMEEYAEGSPSPSDTGLSERWPSELLLWQGADRRDLLARNTSPAGAGTGEGAAVP